MENAVYVYTGLHSGIQTASRHPRNFARPAFRHPCPARKRARTRTRATSRGCVLVAVGSSESSRVPGPPRDALPGVVPFYHPPAMKPSFILHDSAPRRLP